MHGRLAVAVATAAGLCACAVSRDAALEGLAQTLGGGSAAGVFASDDDPELVREALPFSLKATEALVARSPESVPLRAAAAAGFVQYAAAFLDEDAARLADADPERARALRARAAGLYRRGRDHALAGLGCAHPGLPAALRGDAEAALAAATRADVPLLFWAGAGWAGAIGAASGDAAAVADLPLAVALVRRALALDESWGDGMIHELFILLEGRGSGAGGEEGARAHFDRAVALTGGRKASPFVALAGTVSVRRQDRTEFRALLARALAVDVDAEPRWRLANELSRRKARWLLAREGDLFLEEAPP